MLELLTPSQEKAPDGTDYNDPPIGLRRITQAEFAKSKFFSYMPKALEWRQIYVTSSLDLTANRNGKMIDLQMYWYHDGTGIAIHGDYWGNMIEYFSFGCEHTYRELSKSECGERNIPHFGMCYHVAECTKCKYIDSYDSSG